MTSILPKEATGIRKMVIESRKMLRRDFLFGAGVGALAMGASSCTYIETELDSRNQNSKELRVRVQAGRPLIIGIEGAFRSGYIIHNLTARIADNLNLAQSAGKANYRQHIDIAKQAHANRGKIIVMGFSAGGEMARGIAEELGRGTPKVPVNLLIYLDAIYTAGLFPGKISDNVERVVNYMSEHTSRGLSGVELTEKNCQGSKTEIENYLIRGTEHITLPKSKELQGMIEAEIRKVLAE